MMHFMQGSRKSLEFCRNRMLSLRDVPTTTVGIINQPPFISHYALLTFFLTKSPWRESWARKGGLGRAPSPPPQLKQHPPQRMMSAHPRPTFSGTSSRFWTGSGFSNSWISSMMWALWPTTTALCREPLSAGDKQRLEPPIRGGGGSHSASSPFESNTGKG